MRPGWRCGPGSACLKRALRAALTACAPLPCLSALIKLCVGVSVVNTQVLPCSKRFVHDWTVCPFAHPGEKAKRRDPRVFSYTGVACPEMKKVRACPPV